MTRPEKAAIAAAVLFVVVAIGIWGAYRWSNTVPRRPKGVRNDAVFLWAPYVGLPAPRRGWWIACWEASPGHPFCRLSDIDGATEYEGEFSPYRSMTGVPLNRLKIDPTKTRDHRIWVGDALVPLVFLENGEILIPTANYEKGKRLLDREAEATRGSPRTDGP